MIRGRRTHRLAVALFALLVTGACQARDQREREAFLERSDAERLVGGWNVTLVLERPLNDLYDRRVTARPIAGTIAFTLNRTSDDQFADFGRVTHKGVYDLDLGAFGLPAAGGAESQSAVARTVPVHMRQGVAGSAPGADSVLIALVPADTRLWMRLTGVLLGDSIAGSWTAEVARTGANGRFAMTRQRAVP
jgi:hypothetical protein